MSTSNFLALYKSKASQDIRNRLFAQVLEGIAFLHKHNITHRDIKPANLTVRSYDPPDAQIIDFGCATTETRTLYDRPGTIPYLAPEQQDGRYHDKSVDYWACALVGAELVGLKRNNDRVVDAGFETIHNWLDRQAANPVTRCCKDMLKIEPKQRMTAADALVEHLSGYQGELNKGFKRTIDDR